MNGQMYSIHISNHNDWTKKNGVLFSGAIYFNGNVRSGENACELFGDVQSSQDLKDIVANSSGFFSIVIQLKDEVLITVDQAGSKQLFYTNSVDKLNISDSYRALQKFVSNKKTPKTIQNELLKSGYVSQGDTLHPEIKKTQAGVIYSFSFENEKVDQNQLDHFQYNVQNKIKDKGEAINELESVLKKVTDKLIAFADGSPIILFLSSGYDSRLLAHMLNQNNVGNVYTVTGDQQNNEFTFAKEISNKLGFDWTKLEVSHKDINQIHRSSYWEPIEKHVEGYRAPMPELNTIVYLKKLKNNDSLPDDGVIVKGHTIAEAGKRIPSSFLKQNKIDAEKVAYDILSRHYTETTRHPDQVPNSELRNRILSWIGTSSELTQVFAIQKCENWYWSQRIPHYLMCDSSVYNQFGYRYWHPFLDREYLEFYTQLSVQHRYKRKLLESYTDRLDENAGIQSDNPNNDRSTLENIIIASPFEAIARKIRNKIKYLDPINVYESDKRYGYMSENEFLDRYTGEERYNCFLAEDILQNSASDYKDA